MFRIEEGKAVPAGEDRIRGLSNEDFISSFSRLLRGPGQSESDCRGIDHVFSLYAREQLRRIEAGELNEDVPGATIHVVQKVRWEDDDEGDWWEINSAPVSYRKNSRDRLSYVTVFLGLQWIRVEVGSGHYRGCQYQYEMLYPRRTKSVFFVLGMRRADDGGFVKSRSLISPKMQRRFTAATAWARGGVSVSGVPLPAARQVMGRPFRFYPWLRSFEVSDR